MTDESRTTYYWLRDDILARMLDGWRIQVWCAGRGPWRDHAVNVWTEGTPISEQEAERRLLARGETSPFPPRLPGVETTDKPMPDGVGEESGEIIRYENPQTGEYIYVRFV